MTRCRARDTKRILEGMKMTTSGVVSAAMVAGAPNEFSYLLAIEETDVRVSIALVQEPDMTSGVLGKTCTVIGMDETRLIVALDRVALAQPVEMVAGLEGELPEGARISGSEFLFEPVGLPSETNMNLATIATRRTPTYAGLFKQHDIRAATRQM
jgi:hypothetical protein